MNYMEQPREWDSQTEEEWDENDKLGEDDTTQETQNAIFDEQEEKTTDY